MEGCGGFRWSSFFCWALCFVIALFFLILNNAFLDRLLINLLITIYILPVSLRSSSSSEPGVSIYVP